MATTITNLTPGLMADVRMVLPLETLRVKLIRDIGRNSHGEKVWEARDVYGIDRYISEPQIVRWWAA